MISDERQKLLAKNLVEYSISVQKGEKVWIDAFGIDVSFVNALVDAVYAAGGQPYVFLHDRRVERAVLKNVTDEQLEHMAAHDARLMSEMQCYIGVRGGQTVTNCPTCPTTACRRTTAFTTTPCITNNACAKPNGWSCAIPRKACRNLPE